MRFKTYKLDFEENNHSLFIQEMNRNKKITKDSALAFFRDVYEWFDDDLVTMRPDQPFTNFEYFYGDEGNRAINEIIEIFDTGISRVKKEEIPMNDFKNKVNDVLAKKLIQV